MVASRGSSRRREPDRFHDHSPARFWAAADRKPDLRLYEGDGDRCTNRRAEDLPRVAVESRRYVHREHFRFGLEHRLDDGTRKPLERPVQSDAVERVDHECWGLRRERLVDVTAGIDGAESAALRVEPAEVPLSVALKLRLITQEPRVDLDVGEQMARRHEAVATVVSWPAQYDRSREAVFVRERERVSRDVGASVLHQQIAGKQQTCLRIAIDRARHLAGE